LLKLLLKRRSFFYGLKPEEKFIPKHVQTLKTMQFESLIFKLHGFCFIFMQFESII